MVDESTFRLSFLVVSFFVASLLASWYRRDPLLDAIPTVGFSDPILSYFSALRFHIDGLPMLKYGYENARRGVFRIAGFRRWMVLVSGPELVEDVRKAPEDVLSVKASTAELFQLEYTLGLFKTNRDYHIDVIRSKLTRNVAATFRELRDELIRSFDASIPVHGDDWVKIPVLETMRRVVSATSNRVFVGSPLCRDQGYLTLNLNFAVNVMKFAMIIGMFPKPLRPIVARLLSNLPSRIRQEMEYIRPMVEERFARMEEFGDDWDDKPNDMLMWLMSESKGAERSLEDLALRMLMVNFGAIHTTSQAFTIVLYRLLSNPEYIEPLRHEVETAVAEEGWTKAGMDKMHKIDSLLRESLRVDTILSLRRITLRPFTFSNGVTVPAGTLVAVPSAAVHMDGEIYPNPEEFDGFRFAKLRERDGVAVAGHQATSTSAEFLTFGHGRHACPGRFFAANEVKALLAHVIVTYDIKFEEGRQAPRSFIINSIRIPGKTNVMFRKRQK
ncbi:cytochrome P450 [Lactarius akahatsu]|uniref:Cytochrome P450 n=1 Tax=Lactarius akahatsu TaxID=416441 RepID=A0AAD4LQF6_9AGAM|nr:cytochrome P450 [Lactarius akahatsu]